MTKIDAVRNLISEAQTSYKLNQTRLNRAAKSCVALGLSPSETVSIMIRLDLCNENGEPYGGLKRTWL